MRGDSAPLLSMLALFFGAQTASAKPAPPPEGTTPDGLVLRGGLSAVPMVFGFSYEGPPNASPGLPAPAPGEEIAFDTQGLSVGGEVFLGLGGFTTEGLRLGIDAGWILGSVIAGGDALPETNLSIPTVASAGPSVGTVLDDHWELEGAVRFAMAFFGGNQNDIGSPDNVVELVPHYGAMARLGMIHRSTPTDTLGWRFGLEGGPQFADHQRTFFVALTAGIQLGR